MKKRNARLTKKVNLQPGRKYRIVLVDKKGNGFCCSRRRGKKGFVTVQALRKNIVVWQAKVSGKFSEKRTVEFTVPAVFL